MHVYSASCGQFPFRCWNLFCWDFSLVESPDGGQKGLHPYWYTTNHMDHKAQRRFTRSKTALKFCPTLHCCSHCGGWTIADPTGFLQGKTIAIYIRTLGHPTLQTLKIHPNNSEWLPSGFVVIKMTVWHRFCTSNSTTGISICIAPVMTSKRKDLRSQHVWLRLKTPFI